LYLRKFGQTATDLRNYADIDLSGVSANPAALTINGNAFNFASVEIGSFSQVTASGTYTQRAGFMTVTGRLNTLTVALEGGEINVAGSLNSAVNDPRCD
jgi:hypothetical protein